MNFEIKTTGSGTIEEIIEALRYLADDLERWPSILYHRLPGTTWEGSTLITEIKEAC